MYILCILKILALLTTNSNFCLEAQIPTTEIRIYFLDTKQLLLLHVNNQFYYKNTSTILISIKSSTELHLHDNEPNGRNGVQSN